MLVTAPLAVMGIWPELFAMDLPFGFVALLGARFIPARICAQHLTHAIDVQVLVAFQAVVFCPPDLVSRAGPMAWLQFC